MREIKFRAWDKYDHHVYKNPNPPKRMTYYDTPIVSDDGFIQMDCIGQSAIGDSPIGERHIIMQYIGLKDKNGVEIYEGDIVRLDKSTTVWEVKYHTPLLQYIADDGDGFTLINHTSKIEIIGNIYENPELLQG